MNLMDDVKKAINSGSIQDKDSNAIYTDVLAIWLQGWDEENLK